ncbi:hypothetical protein [Devosia sp.]|uniref:hypothetical protein n=1 Tax=Devosia sp. TaxID=1871048 RepID=UPI0035B07BD4
MARVTKGSGLAEDTAPWRDDREPIYFAVEVKAAGRVLLPAKVRAALGVGEGDTLRGVVRDGELTLMTSDTALRKTQERLRKLVPPGVSLVDELIAERRAENAREEAETAAYLAGRNAPK